MPSPVCKVLLDLHMNAESNAEKYVSLKAEFNSLHLRCDELKSAAEDHLSVLTKAQADKHQIYIQSIRTHKLLRKL
nr:nuclear-pore anchor [Tanacetum cinerariifolium]